MNTLAGHLLTHLDALRPELAAGDAVADIWTTAMVEDVEWRSGILPLHPSQRRSVLQRALLDPTRRTRPLVPDVILDAIRAELAVTGKADV